MNKSVFDALQRQAEGAGFATVSRENGLLSLFDFTQVLCLFVMKVIRRGQQLYFKMVGISDYYDLTFLLKNHKQRQFARASESHRD